jgi:hypothetical protein
VSFFVLAILFEVDDMRHAGTPPGARLAIVGGRLLQAA